MIAFEPLSCNTHDATHNTLQRKINTACKWILDALEPNALWSCHHCEITAPRPEWVQLRRLNLEADRRYQESEGTKYQGLEGSIYSLAVHHLADQGVIERAIGKGIRLSRRTVSADFYCAPCAAYEPCGTCARRLSWPSSSSDALKGKQG